MIVELNINNFGIMENISINFTEGFNILTGETGAGKSIIVEGLNMILGDRANTQMIKTGCEKATIEGLFYTNNEKDINEKLNEFGIEPEETGYILITREIFTTGKSISRINGRPITLSMLNQITKKLVDIHSQHEHQSLLNKNNHIKLIDSFARTKIDPLIKKISEEFNLLKMKKEELGKINLDPIEKDRNIDLYNYQLRELTEFDLDNYNEEEIFNQYNKLSNIKNIEITLEKILNLLKNEEYTKNSILDNLHDILNMLKDIENFDKDIASINNEISSIYYSLEDILKSIRIYSQNINLDEENYILVEEKIEFIENLKRKYGKNLEEVINYREEIKSELEFLKSNEVNIKNLENEIKNIENKLLDLSKDATKIRRKAADILTKNILTELKDLNMNNVNFQIDFKEKTYFTDNGLDDIEFLISTNVGEKLKPLSKVISGGEMSRMMLAFKTVFADYDNIETLIFDEIDTGISGKTAELVGLKIKDLSKSHQIICISHLPQIASLADTHFLIDKKVLENGTLSYVKKLNLEEKVLEISRLLGGVNITEATLIHAKEMLGLNIN